mmetsp:Transcript_121424/g.388302  ORF Transcript_121424/g.388302 Transcript_121424/m.388302 type:complete len:421 (-) Transcript_121424:2-1264(-)
MHGDGLGTASVLVAATIYLLRDGPRRLPNAEGHGAIKREGKHVRMRLLRRRRWCSRRRWYSRRRRFWTSFAPLQAAPSLLGCRPHGPPVIKTKVTFEQGCCSRWHDCRRLRASKVLVAAAPHLLLRGPACLPIRRALGAVEGPIECRRPVTTRASFLPDLAAKGFFREGPAPLPLVPTCFAIVIDLYRQLLRKRLQRRQRSRRVTTALHMLAAPTFLGYVPGRRPIGEARCAIIGWIFFDTGDGLDRRRGRRRMQHRYGAGCQSEDRKANACAENHNTPSRSRRRRGQRRRLHGVEVATRANICVCLLQDVIAVARSSERHGLARTISGLPGTVDKVREVGGGLGGMKASTVRCPVDPIARDGARVNIHGRAASCRYRPRPPRPDGSPAAAALLRARARGGGTLRGHPRFGPPLWSACSA